MTCLIGFNNVLANAVLSSTGTFEALLPMANVKDTLLAKVAQTTTDAAFSFTIAFVLSKSVGVVAMDNHNVSNTGTLRVQCYNGATLKADSGLIKSTAERFFAFVLPSVQLVNKVIISIDDTANAAGFIQVGRLFVGDFFQPAKGVEYGDLSQSVTDMSELISTPSGVNFSYQLPTLRSASVAWKVLSSAELITLHDLQRTHGKTDELIFIRQRPAYTDVSGELLQDLLSASMSFMGNAVELDPLTSTFFGAYAGGIGIREIAV